MKRALQLNEKDNVATVIETVKRGELVEILWNGICVNKIIVNDEIKKYFKVALIPISKDEVVIKYGEVIGRVNMDRHIGDIIHVDEVRSIKV